MSMFCKAYKTQFILQNSCDTIKQMDLRKQGIKKD